MQASDMPFTRLINVDQGAREHFHVPKYQREYTWGKWEWEQLLNDIEDNDPGYFMGSIDTLLDWLMATARNDDYSIINDSGVTTLEVKAIRSAPDRTGTWSR